MPCLPTVSTIRERQKQFILSGELNIGEPCAPFHLTKSVVTHALMGSSCSMRWCSQDSGRVELSVLQILFFIVPLDMNVPVRFPLRNYCNV